MTSSSYTIQGVKVVFPHKPYPSQFCMMERIIKGLERRQNCLLESPTGSGKSLALLCSALAWQETERVRQEVAAAEDGKKTDDCGDCQCQKNQAAAIGVTETPSTSLTATNQNPPLPHAVGQSKSGTAGPSSTPGNHRNPILIDDIEDFDLDDDFKCEKKKFRTPLQVSRSHQLQSNQASTEDVDGSGTELGTAASSTESPGQTCCSCSCEGDELKKVLKLKIPKIYFGTRTHKQIAQIARELGKTDYRHSRMTILASRQHTCIDPEVSSMPNKNEECRNKLEGPGCRFKDRAATVTHNRLQDFGLDSAWDLEEFVAFCKKCKACPYFGSRGLRETADIILCPYNYLIDPKIRNSMEINLKEQIVILDEGHNIEDSARESASLTITQRQMVEAEEDLLAMINGNVKPVEHSALKNLVSGLSAMIDNHTNSLEGRDFDQASKIWSGMDMVAQLKHAGAGQDQFEYLKKCLGAIAEDEEEHISKWKKKNRPQKQVEEKVSTSTLALLEGFFIILDFIYREKMKYMEDYRLALLRTTAYARPTDTSGRWLGKRRRGQRPQTTFVYSLNFWCLNPAVAFSDMKDVRSIVLTSGTLSPMTSFQSELDTPFPIQLEASHVIGRSQVWVGAVSKGPRGSQLLGSYQNAETFSYQDDVGQLLLQVCQTIPNGVLCFLSSYKAMEKLSNRWKTTGTWAKIEEHKVIMCEPRAHEQVDFDQLMKTFYRVIEKTQDPDNTEEPAYEGDTCLVGKTGALFMAVVRGKVSEGMDFADNNARAVLTVGIPYPNVKDTQVILKKQYNETHCVKRGLLSGRDWYEIQAYRALNQALGRCIRHRHDWGALILVDERFGKNQQKYVKGLSKWLRGKVQFYEYFQQAKNSLQQFTKERKECAATNDVSIMMSQTQSPSVSGLQQTQRLLGFTPTQGAGSFTPGAASPVTRPPIESPSPETITQKSNQEMQPPKSTATTPQRHNIQVTVGPKAPGNQQSFFISFGEERVQVLADSLEKALTQIRILNNRLHLVVSPNTVMVAPPTLTKTNQSSSVAAPVPARFMNMSQAGGFLPSQGALSQTQATQRRETASRVPEKVNDPNTTMVETSHVISQFNPAFTSTQISQQKKNNPMTMIETSHSSQINPPLTATQFNPAFTSTQNPTQFCSQFAPKFTSTQHEDVSVHKSAESDSSKPLQTTPGVTKTQNVTEISSQFTPKFTSTQLENPKVPKITEVQEMKTPKGKLTFDTPEKTQNKTPETADSKLNSTPDTPTLFKFHPNLESPEKATSKNNLAASFTTLRPESPDLFEEEDCFSNSPEKVNAVLEALKAEPLEQGLDAGESAKGKLETKANAKSDQNKEPNTQVSKSLKTEAPERDDLKENTNAAAPATNPTNTRFNRSRNRLKKRSLSKSMIDIDTAEIEKPGESSETVEKISEEATRVEVVSRDGDTTKWTASSESGVLNKDGEEEEAACLNTRRSKRRRMSTFRQTPSKTCNFNESAKPVFTCGSCGQPFTSEKGLQKRTRLPAFMSVLDPSSSEVYVGSSLVENSHWAVQQLKPGLNNNNNPPVNCYWSETDCCTVQWLLCHCAHPTTQGKGHRGHKGHAKCVGALVVQVATDCHEDVRRGQVWILPSAVKLA